MDSWNLFLDYKAQNSLDFKTSKNSPDSGIQITVNGTIVFVLFAFETSQYNILRVHILSFIVCNQITKSEIRNLFHLHFVKILIILSIPAFRQ